MSLKLTLRLSVFILASCLYACTPTTSPEKEEPIITLPEVVTKAILNVSLDSARCEGYVSSNGGGKISARGFCWSKDSLPTIKDSLLIETDTLPAYSSLISKLDTATVYYIRAYATNEKGVGYGRSIQFSTSFKDIDGNIYRTVLIGTHLWMKENLKVKHFVNGDAIEQVTYPGQWESAHQNRPVFCSYDFADSNAIVYGHLYNYMVIADPRGIAPKGWRLPQTDDWKEIYMLSNYSNTGGMMKEKGTDHWLAPNTGANNSLGFTALGAGYIAWGGFLNLGMTALFWSDPAESFTCTVSYDADYLAGTGNDNSILGMSIRCVKQ